MHIKLLVTEKTEEVSTPEIMECVFVNAALHPLCSTPVNDDSQPDRYIINVSAMEGKFYQYKMPNHLHTNIAKAALSMLTQTSAEDLSRKLSLHIVLSRTGKVRYSPMLVDDVAF